jgi:hypothetical protein
LAWSIDLEGSEVRAQLRTGSACTRVSRVSLGRIKTCLNKLFVEIDFIRMIAGIKRVIEAQRFEPSARALIQLLLHHS